MDVVTDALVASINNADGVAWTAGKSERFQGVSMSGESRHVPTQPRPHPTLETKKHPYSIKFWVNTHINLVIKVPSGEYAQPVLVYHPSFLPSMFLYCLDVLVRYRYTTLAHFAFSLVLT